MPAGFGRIGRPSCSSGKNAGKQTTRGRKWIFIVRYVNGPGQQDEPQPPNRILLRFLADPSLCAAGRRF